MSLSAAPFWKKGINSPLKSVVLPMIICPVGSVGVVAGAYVAVGSSVDSVGVAVGSVEIPVSLLLLHPASVNTITTVSNNANTLFCIKFPP